jgi:catechol 2,3-dioxygenase-like lactoylglutathione lyase family enzyme
VAATGLNHVSVVARDLEASSRFYEELFGVERLPTPNFGFPVRWLRVGDVQLHLFERRDAAPTYHHFALAVDDLPAVYERARELDAFDRTAFGHYLYELPDDIAQLYLRDPGGNLVEVDAPRASALPADIRAQMRRLADAHPQDAENLRATLFLGG